MTRKRIPCTLSSRVIGPSSHSGSLGRVRTLGKIGPMAFLFVHGKCQHYYESGQSRGRSSLTALFSFAGPGLENVCLGDNIKVLRLIVPEEQPGYFAGAVNEPARDHTLISL